MKENTEKFFSNGYHMLLGLWLNVVFMVTVVVIGILRGEWQVCVFGILVYLPWIFLFIDRYRTFKRDRRLMDNLLVIEGIMNAAVEKIKRYEEAFGKLPEDAADKTADKETLKEA